MKNIDRNFVLVALCWLIVGTVFGLWMGATHSLQYRVVHVGMLLPGFVTLAIYGMLYRLWPKMGEHKVATTQFWLANVGQLFMLIGAWQYETSGAVWLVAPASVVVIVAVLILAWLFWSTTSTA